MAEKAKQCGAGCIRTRPICRAHEGRSDRRHGRLCTQYNAIPDSYTMRSGVNLKTGKYDVAMFDKDGNIGTSGEADNRFCAQL